MAGITALALPPTSNWSTRTGLLPRLIKLRRNAAAGFFGAVRAIRSALVDESETRETAAVHSGWSGWRSPRWPDGLAKRTAQSVRPVMLLPVSLLAAQTIADLANRGSRRVVILLAPATAMSIAWWASADLSEAVEDLIRGQADTATALGLHLALDLVVASAC